MGEGLGGSRLRMDVGIFGGGYACCESHPAWLKVGAQPEVPLVE
ncbi:hypothetical protein V6N11_010036 [Hibiscus sabdariffa]|uniref:Uncharacterized protein n=1 Tax=Hibiscus sabdariffa TaxID=183260 RepID=A0ABR2PDF7_9ROSI